MKGIQYSIWQLWNFKIWTSRILPGYPVHFSIKLSKETHIYFQRSIQIAESLVEKSLFWPTFWKSGSKNACFSRFSGNPANGFLKYSLRQWHMCSYTFLPNFVTIRCSVQKFLRLQTELPHSKKQKFFVHISSIFHDSSRTKVGFDLARLEKKSIFSRN